MEEFPQIIVTVDLPDAEVSRMAIGETLEFHLEDADGVDVAIRVYAFVVTPAIQDADAARFAYTAELADTNRMLDGRVKMLEALVEGLGGEVPPKMEVP